MLLIKDVLSGWVGLNNTVQSLYIGKEYKYKCNNICDKPTDINDLLRIMDYDGLEENIEDVKAIIQNANSGNLHYYDNISNEKLKNSLKVVLSSHGAEDSTRCRLYGNRNRNTYEYVPKKCIFKFDKNSPILNNVDGETYIFLEAVDTPITGNTPTFIFKKQNTNMIFIIFGFGHILEKKEINIEENKQKIMDFILNTLLKYLQQEDVMIIMCGHSAGMVNALLIGEELCHSALDNKYNLINTRKYKNICMEKINASKMELKTKAHNLEIKVRKMNTKLIDYKNQRNEYLQKLQQKYQTCSYETLAKLDDITDLFTFADLNNFINEYNFIYSNDTGKGADEYGNSLFKKMYNVLNECKENQQIILFLVLSVRSIDNDIHYIEEKLYDETQTEGNEYQQIMDLHNNLIVQEQYLYNDLTKYRECVCTNNKQLRNKIFICGSAGYPCLGDHTLDYEVIKKFYNNRILHFRLPEDYFLEMYLEDAYDEYFEQNIRTGIVERKLKKIDIDLYRTDLIEINDDINDSNDLIFHTALDLKNKQKYTDYTKWTIAMNIKHNKAHHKWSKYASFLNIMLNNELSIKKIKDNYRIVNDEVSGGGKQYLENKTNYLYLRNL